MGADVTDDQILEVMMEADHNQDNTLDIDEFVNLFTLGDRINFKPETRQTYNRI